MTNLTNQLQTIAERCEQLLFAFKLFTLPENLEGRQFLQNEVTITHPGSCLGGRS